MTQRITMAVFACAGLLGCHATGDVSLFNGRDLEGWVIENDAAFSVRDGLLFVDRGTGWLRSERELGDFVLRLDFRFLEAEANSGIFVRTGATSHDDDNGWPDNGYQVQCKDELAMSPRVAEMIPYGGKGLAEGDWESDVEKILSAYRGVGKWNSYEIECVGETITVCLNGVEVTRARNVLNASGHVGIQAEHGRLEFRNLFARALP